MKPLFVYVLHLISLAVHLPQVVPSGGAPAYSIDIVLNSSDFQTADTTIHDFGPGEHYYLIFTEQCPNDTFSVSSDGGVSITREVEFVLEDLEPVCARTSQGSVVSIQTYSCFAVTETTTQSYGVLMIIHVLANSPSTQIQFQEEFYSAEVMEGVQGAPVLGGGGIQAISLPITNLLTPGYRILNGHGSFALSEYSIFCNKYIQIHTTQVLDRETQDYYDIVIEAYTAQASANATIRVSVLDTNDISPEFQLSPETVTVSDRSLRIGEKVTQFQASDGDLGLNARLFHFLVSFSSLFTINPFTGSLYRYSSESLEQTTQTVGVSDLGSPQHEILKELTIFIDDEHQQLPFIHDLGSVVASESDLINHVVSTIHITYSSGSLVVGLDSLNCNCFKLSTLTEDSDGEYTVDLLVNSQLDFESLPDGVNVTITATDADNAQYTTTITVNVSISDENEPPVFLESEYEIAILEGTPVGSEIFRVSALDPDLGTNGVLSYTVTVAPEGNPFSLGVTTGIIHSVDNIDYETLESVELTITVEDGGGEMDQTILKITILDRNDQQPSFTDTEQTIQISETVSANESIYHFSASDEDSQCNGAISYSIIYAEPPLFRIDPVSGLLYPLEDGSIDYEQFRSAVVVVRASDLGTEESEFTDTTLFIDVEGVNDERPILSKIRCPCFMIEATDTMQTCPPLSATDADSNILTFTFRSGNEQNLFSISPESGIVSTTATLSYGPGLEFNLEIVASDGELESDPETLKIIVVDKNNDDPNYDSNIEIVQPEDIPVGSLLGNVSVQNEDTGYNALTEYNIIGNEVDDVIRIDPLSGRLYLNSAPEADEYSFSVTATDGLDGSSIVTASVTIQFSGQLNHAPKFQTPVDHIDIASNSQTGTVLHAFRAEDDDSGSDGLLTYSLATPSDFFQVHNNGSLSLYNSLSDEVGSEFTLMVLVADGGTPSLQDTLELRITVYESLINIGGETFIYNPGIGIRHHLAEIHEETSQSLVVLQLPEMEGPNPVQYAILPQGGFFNVFRIQNQNEVFTKENFQHVFDRTENEAVFITVRAQYANNFHYVSLTVAILDINNNGPKFSQDLYTVEIYRNTPQGGYIFEFDAQDPDIGSNAITTYAVDPASDTFAIVEGTAFLELTASELEEDSYSVTIVASDAGSDALPTDTATLTITILETTNNPPIIDPITISVLESASGNLLTVTVSDTDSGAHGDNILCLASGNVGDHFRIDQNGDIILDKELDYETKDSFTLSIMAYDSSLNPASSVTQVRILVEDDNDAPIFMPDNYYATVVENNAAVMSVLTVTAFDADSDDVIVYSIENGTTAFSVDATTGEVSTALSFNRESVTQHSFLVSATDGGKTSLANVVVTVLDENDNDPTFFSPNFVGLREDTTVGTEVIRLEAMDDDEGQNSSVKFEIVSGNEANIFTLDPFTGSVTLSSSLDFESDPQSIVLTFSVSDLGFPPRTSPATHQITYSLENANDNYPVFSSQLYSCSIPEGDHSFNPPCQVSTTDGDESDTVTYRIVDGNVGSTFQINPMSGQVTRLNVIDREDVPRYYLKVEAADTGVPSLSSYTLVVVEVQDENDNLPNFDPVIASHILESNVRLSQIYISELLPNNTLLFFAHAVDSDSGENGEISYNIISENTELFRIDSNTSAVFLVGQLDHETSQSHELSIQATNPSASATLQTYTINVLNEKENLFLPAFSPDTTSAVSISIAAPIGVHLTDINATDADPGPGGIVRYYITGGSGYGYFTIDQIHGEISVLYNLTGIEASGVTLDILVSDLGSPSLSSSFTLFVILEPDEGAKPFFTSAMCSAVAPETFAAQNVIFASVGALVSGQLACDVTYSIVSGNEEGKFSINSSSGAISKITALDREVESMYTLIVSASRGSTVNTSYALVDIEVADSNDHTPTFSVDFDVTIFNDQPTGPNNAFMRVFAVDQDSGENSRLEYSIISDSSNSIAIDSTSGDLYLTQSLPSNSYVVTVSVTDMATLPLSQSTTFTINTLPPASGGSVPSFTSSSTVAEVSEDTDPGYPLHTAEASDSSDDHLVYRITEPLPNFAIMPNSGQVYLIKPLDKEAEEQYTIRIEASDGSLTSSAFLLNVVVRDVNDNRPAFTTEEFVFTVEEHFDIGELVGSISATDIDDDNRITYSLVDSTDPNSINLFSLSDDGMLEVAGTIDREAQPIHVLTVSAEDSGTPSLATYSRVKIVVTDINDHTPVFVFPPQTVSVSENTTVGTPFFNVSVFDPDTEGSSLTYSLSPDTTPFAINGSTGEMYVAMELDAEVQTNYSLEIGVSAEDTPAVTATATLLVTVADELDSLPVLTDPGTVTLPENMPPYTIVASVGDSTSHSAVYYEITSGNEENAFFVEPLTGIVRTAIQLDRETTSLYALTIQGAFQLEYKASVTFAVIVSDVNDNAPSFSSQFLEYTLREDSTHSELHFVDSDDGTNGEIGGFYIPDPSAAEMFEVDSMGNIQVRGSLDREGEFSAIDFDLYLFDSGNPPLYDLAHVSISVSDVNDNPPYFQQSSYSFIVSLPAIVDTILFSVRAIDPDQDSTVSYATAGGNGTDKFAINAITGGISVTNNYQLQPYYRLTVSAKDEGGKESTVSVNIATKYCGFMNLLFNPRELRETLPENVENGTVVFSPALLTFDTPPNIMYLFSTSDTLFQINAVTGAVSLDGFLDREKQSTHQFTVQARDTTNPLRIAQADIEIVVEDVNDNVPTFVSAPYVTYITGNHSGEILRVRAVDSDAGSNGEVSYELKVGCSGLFEIEQNTGQISLTEELDTLLLDSCTLNVIASDKGVPALSASTTVTVNVVLSNAPLFTMGGIYSAQVNESAPRDTLVVTVFAMATSDDPHIRYNIESPQSNTLPFSIDFVEGDVTVNGIGLDYETNNSYRLQLEAVDLTTTLTGRATLDIQVLDENDNRPVFSQALYQTSLTENSDTGTSVEQVSASDLDSGSNSDITYFIDPNDIATTLFNIDEETGLISTSSLIDREENDFIRFSVLARDAGTPSLTGTTVVQIEVLDVNDNAPLFLQPSYRGTVLEDDQPGTSILFVTATDPDEDDVEYDIVNTPGSTNFDISPGGLISLATAASELSEFEYSLQISAFDGLFYGYTEVIVELENENNNAPMFNASTYSAFILENATIGTVVVQVFATDDDRGANADLTYSMSSNLFAINSATGVITVNAELDREANTNGVTLIVIARDGGGRTGTAEVDIELGDINDNAPVFSQVMYGFDVQETTQIGTTVSTIVMASDPDDGSNGLVRYTIHPSTDPSQFPFAIDEQSGAITTTLDVDPIIESQYIFTVSARDMGVPEMSADPQATVTVQVTTAGEVPPQFENLTYQVPILENNQHGVQLLTPLLVMTDETVVCDVITYYLLNNDDSLFRIPDDSISNVTVNTILDREDMVLHILTIQAECLPLESSNILRAFAVIYVNVLDMNESPAFSPGFLIGYILEGIPLNTILEFVGGINFIEAHDEDSGENGIISYSITDDVPFVIHPLTGIITVDGNLDRETTDIYRFDVFATDLGNPPLSDSIRIRVNIEDINDSPPVFDQEVYTGEVVENSVEGTSVLTVTASDADLEEFAVNVYSVSGSSAFTIGNTTGQLTVVGGIDRETTSEYTLVVTASDGVQHATTNVVIDVLDVNDNPPFFNATQYTIEVPENYATGTALLQVFASDMDLGENAEISYGILEDQQLLHINSSSGEVSFSQSPDYEMSPRGHFEFRVTATNPNDENQRALSTLIIDLLDLNDNAPQFTDQGSPIHVAENQPSEITVVRVVADDLDSGLNARVEYSLSEEAQQYFAIDSQTGTITTRVTFNREANSSFEVSVTATDLGTPPLSGNTTLLISISDVNDNPPVFSHESYTVRVLESVSVDSIIENIRADDADEGVNAELMYRLTGDNGAHFLLVMLDNGSIDIQVAQQLNHENINQYDLNITAFDGGFPFLQATVPLTVVVLDENDNPPEFDPPFYTAIYPESLPLGSEITRVHARDPDSTETTQLTYSIFEAITHPQFEIDTIRGLISLAESLDFEEDQVHTFVVQADDQVHTATATVIVTVTNVNDNAPEFVTPNVTRTIIENMEGYTLFESIVHDRDRDSDPGTISFKIESGNTAGIFDINPISGALSFEEFDFEALSTSEYILTVTASDNEDPPLFGTAYVTVHAQDVNDNPPEGENQVIHVFLYNGQLTLRTLGTLLIRDPDTVNDHQFNVTGGNSDIFHIEFGGGIDILQHPPPPGVYSFTVHVTDGDLGEAITTVDILVVNITDAHLTNSFTMQVRADSVVSFLDTRLQRFLKSIETLVVDKTSIRNPEAYLFNIAKSGSGTVDITIVVEAEDGNLVHPNLIQHLIHINRDLFEVDILTESVNHCDDESVCPVGTICTKTYQYSSASEIIGSAAASLVGIDSAESITCLSEPTTCSVSCPEPSLCVQQSGESVCVDDCTPNPCKNNGECHEQMPGYYCSCPSGFNGRNCELTTSYFKEGSYAILPAVTTSTNGTITVEFVADESDEGLMFYSSRFDDNLRDFIALELIDNHLSLLVSYGSDPMRLSVMLSGKGWYAAAIDYTSAVSTVHLCIILLLLLCIIVYTFAVW